MLRYLSRKYNGCCAIAKSKGKYARITELHHRAHNTKRNRKKWPLFIDSVWNLAPVNHDMHMMWPSALKIRDDEGDRKEAFLRAHPEVARAVNLGIGGENRE